MEANIRTRTREVMRAELARSAWTLMSKRGADITVDELSTELGISRATFFRYFESKDDVVATHLSVSGSEIAANLTTRLADHPGESVWEALTAAFSLAAQATRKDQVALMISVPAWYARFLLRRIDQIEDIAEALSHHRSLDARSAQATAVMAIGLLDASLREWIDSAETAFADVWLENLKAAGAAAAAVAPSAH